MKTHRFEKRWQDVVVEPEMPLEKAIEILDRGGLRIVLVADAAQRLVGTVTDGDIRRALLKHRPLDSPVRDVMCKHPHSAGSDWSKDRILAVMEDLELLQIPVVDEDSRLIGLETLHGLMERRTLDNPVFLMAGGFGTRLRPLTNDCPKPLLKVGDKPILELILESLVNAGFHHFYISTHYLPEMIQEYFGDGSLWGVKIEYVHEEEPLGTGGALGLLPSNDIDLPLLMMNGDLLTTINYRELLDFHRNHDSIATMCVRQYEHQIPYGVVQTDGAYIQSMDEKPVQKCFINAGIYVIAPEIVRSVKKGTRIDMPTLLEKQMAQGEKVSMFPVHEYWLDIGKMDDFQRAQSEVGLIL
ncbi:nucleotidyltransferase family protein [Marinobacter koreensis]|jgi:dTDP-glucose pyrophosphorylase/CBS domain-containing protein|uniref:Nucleotidyltransferase family protein n=1 Tax=Marinobacter koreensis TaxID=335974 RepID=A0ABW0RJ14_9GAMM|nr:nucleotidyltransferase family protein [Marinobacter koreensis]MCK7547003.1 nucleotidyltransferase family protein [Marinobacter koreensis]